MDDNDLLNTDELDDAIEGQIIEESVPVQPMVVNIQPNKLIVNDKALASEAANKELELRKLEMAEWAEKKKILKGAPKIKELNRVWNKLKKGYPIIKAIKGVVSVATWHKWREEYPEIAAMEIQCREERVEQLQEKIRSIAEQEDRTRMGEVSRDKLMIDAYQTEIDRIDRLTENRNNGNKNNGFGTINPIQINLAFGKKK